MRLSNLMLWLAVALMALPLVVIASSLGEYDPEIWQYVWEDLLPVLVSNTLWLCLGVGIGVTLLGTVSAWLTAMYEFPARKVFFWAMMLPLAMPAYVLAFTQLGLFDYTGPISTYLREHWQFENGLPEVRNVWGLTWVMSLTFYPYVYLLARNAFSSMGKRALEAGAALGRTPYQSFWQIALPMARPWIAGGVVLALMEVLADFGTVAVFSYDTFSLAIYQAWFDLFSLETAKQLAMLMIVVVFVLLILEQKSRGARRFTQAGKAQAHSLYKLTGAKAWLATLWCGMVLFLAFLLPIIQLCIWAVETWETHFNELLFERAWHSLSISLMAALVISLFALLMALAQRDMARYRPKYAMMMSRLATLGYAIPGAVLAVGIFIPVAWFDNQLVDWFNLPAGTEVIKGTLVVLVIAYTIRFLTLGFTSLSSGLERLSPNLGEAAQSVGVHGLSVIWRVYLPLLKGALATSGLLVFVDVMKEMPITLMIRPFGWDTLAISVFSYTAEGLYANASLPSLLIVLTGLIPVIIFSRFDQQDGD